MKRVNSKLWDSFERYLLTNLACSPHSTIPATIRKLKYMESKYGFNLLTCSKKDVDSFLYNKLSEGVSKSGVNNYIKCINRWCKFRNKKLRIKQYKTVKPVIKIPSVEDIYSMIEKCSSRNFVDRRDRMIIVFLCKTGLRNSELCNLKLDNIDWRNNEIHVINGKGSKDRIIPVEKKVLYSNNYPCLKNYIENWRVGNSKYLFTTKSGKISPAYLRKRVKVIGKKAGISWVYPHCFRHFYATNLRRSGVPLECVQGLLGHSDISSTMIYNHVYINDIRKAIHESDIIDFMGKKNNKKRYLSVANKTGGIKNEPMGIRTPVTGSEGR